MGMHYTDGIIKLTDMLYVNEIVVYVKGFMIDVTLV